MPMTRQLLAALLALGLVITAFPSQAQQPTDLFISEYVEGGGNNKAIELYNGTGASIDLSAYTLRSGINGGALGTGLALSGMLAAGNTFVIARSTAAPALLALANLTTTAGELNFNGDDALVLEKTGGIVVDSLGQLGTDPGTAWGTGSVTTQDDTLRRKAAICVGDSTPGDAFDPAIEYNGFAQDTFDGLGSHTVMCVASPPSVSFETSAVRALEGDSVGNPLNFLVNVNPAPLAGSPVMFEVAVTGEAGRFSYTGPATITVTELTALPLTIAVNTSPNTLQQGNSDVTVTLSNFTGTSGTQSSSLNKIGTIREDDVSASEIFQLQGSDACSPLIVPCNIAVEAVGPLLVRSTDNVVTFVGGGGFFMQTPDARDDQNLQTSNGIFVFTFGVTVTDGDEPLAPGDIVQVSGDIVERFGFTQIRVSSARNTGNSILRSASGAPLPLAVAFGNAAARGTPTEVPSRDPNALSCGTSNFECFEGMRVRMDDGRVAASNQRFGGTVPDLFAEVYASPFGERALRERGVRFGNVLVPENIAAGIWDGNPEVIEMDADFLIPSNNGLELFGGARFTGEGVIGFDFGDYEFWPATLTVDAATNVLPRPVPTSSTDELTIGSFNAFRFCDAVVNSPSNCAPSAGAEIDTVRVAHQLGQVSAYIRQVLRSPDVVGMQEVENLDILTQLATQIADDGGPTYSAHLVEGNDVGGIDVGYLINTSRISNVNVAQLNGNEKWLDPDSDSEDGLELLHDRPPLLLTADFVGNGRPFRFNLINNHTRSRTAVDSGGADGERTRAKRFTQGVSIANLVQGLQTAAATADIPLFVVGDHNAYQFTDGYADVVGLIAGTYANAENTCSPANAVTDCKLAGGNNIVVPAMVNGIDVLDLDERYSYNFTESFGAVQGSTGREIATNQVLDHAMFNSAAVPFVTGIAYGRANVDSSRQRFRVCNYTFRDLALCPQAAGTWVPTGSSDHDGLVIFVTPPRVEDIFANGFEP